MNTRYFEWCGKTSTRPTPPTRKTALSAGYDFHVPETITLQPQQTVMIPTGYRVKLHDNEWLALVIRSSLGKKGIILSNCVGVIDADYYDNPSNHGEIMGMLTNMSDKPYTLEANEAFMQGIILPYVVTDDDTADTKRVGGIGSTNG